MITIGSARELLAGASARQRVEPADARAGAVFERVTVGAANLFRLNQNIRPSQPAAEPALA